MKKNPENRLGVCTIGVGGCGTNMLNRFVRAELKGCKLIAVETSKEHLDISHKSIKKLHIGKSLGLLNGANGKTEIGAKAAEEAREEIKKELKGADLVFVCAGLGGGTGTGAAPIIAKIAKEQGAITVAITIYPFRLEKRRCRKAKEGLARLRASADAVIIMDNNRLLKLVPNLPMGEAFDCSDGVVAKAISDIIMCTLQPSPMGLNLADVRDALSGVGFIACGEGKKELKVQRAVEGVLKNRFLDAGYSNAKGVFIMVSGGENHLTLNDIIKAVDGVRASAAPKTKVCYCARLIPEFGDRMEITAIVTGVKSKLCG